MVARALCTAALVCVAVAQWCHDGTNDPQLTPGINVTMTWAQAPLFSSVPRIGNTTEFLKLFHTLLIFRQDLGSGLQKFWSLEFNSISPAYVFVPKIVNDTFEWSADARWCLREGLMEGRAHWSKSFVDVANLTTAQFTHILKDFVPRYNSSIPGAWPQYQIFRVKDLFGNRIIDDSTCNHVYRVVKYARDSLNVPVKDMVFKGTRVTMRALRVMGERLQHNKPSWALRHFYIGLVNAISRKHAYVDKVLAFFEFFANRPFAHDNNRAQYFSITLGTPLPVLLFQARYEEIGDDMPEEQPEKLPACGLNTRCFDAMKKVCNWGGGLACNVCVDVWYAKLMLLDHCPLVSTLLDVQRCFCHESMSSTEDLAASAPPLISYV